MSKLTAQAIIALNKIKFTQEQIDKIEKSKILVDQFNNFIAEGREVKGSPFGSGVAISRDGKMLTFFGDKHKTWDALAHEMGHYADITQNQRFNKCFDTPNDYVNAVLASEEQAVRNEYQAAKEIYPDVVGKSAQEAAGVCFARGREGR